MSPKRNSKDRQSVVWTLQICAGALQVLASFGISIFGGLVKVSFTQVKHWSSVHGQHNDTLFLSEEYEDGVRSFDSISGHAIFPKKRIGIIFWVVLAWSGLGCPPTTGRVKKKDAWKIGGGLARTVSRVSAQAVGRTHPSPRSLLGHRSTNWHNKDKQNNLFAAFRQRLGFRTARQGGHFAITDTWGWPTTRPKMKDGPSGACTGSNTSGPKF